jgi:hypothetical protein
MDDTDENELCNNKFLKSRLVKREKLNYFLCCKNIWFSDKILIKMFE